jgi:hypothetical protein
MRDMKDKEIVIHDGLRKNLKGMFIFTIVFNIIMVGIIVIFGIILKNIMALFLIITMIFLDGFMYYMSNRYKRKSPHKMEFYKDRIGFIFKIEKNNRELSSKDIEFIHIDHQPYFWGEHNNMKFHLKTGELLDLEAINGDLHRRISEWILENKVQCNRDYNIPLIVGERKEGMDQYKWMEMKNEQKDEK